MSVIFKCKMCGGDLDIKEGSTIAECLYCGRKQTLPKLDDDKRRNLYDRANHFRQNGDFDKAMTIYEQILSEDNTDAEAYWSLVLCRYGIEYVEDPLTHQRVPTVNRTQPVPVTSDEDYKQALHYADDYQTSIYEEEAKAIDEIQKGILEISRREKPFDVFICYKESDNNGQRTPDSVLAVDLYDQLTKEGFKVFCSRITLEDKLGEKYEPYIFAALNSAPVMVALGTKPEYFNAVWVRNEWSRYLTLIKNGARKTLIPAYRDMSPYDLPDEFAHLQAQDMSKLGFMQDLIRGVKKILEDKNSKTQTQQSTSTNTNSEFAPLLERAFMFIEDGDFAKADEYCEKVLDKDPKNSRAYLGKLMAEKRVKNREDFAKLKEPFGNNSNYQKIMRYGDEALVSEIKGYNDKVEQEYGEAARRLAREGININDLNALNEYGSTALMAASLYGDIGTVKALIKVGANVRARGKYGYTALHEAAGEGHTEIVTTLIDAGANVNAENEFHNTALHEAAEEGHTETVKALINAGADINAKGSSGSTALFQAAAKHHAETVNALIEAGADINVTVGDYTAQGVAKSNSKYARTMEERSSYAEIINALKKAGATGAGGCMTIIIEAFAIITALVAVGCLL